MTKFIRFEAPCPRCGAGGFVSHDKERMPLFPLGGNIKCASCGFNWPYIVKGNKFIPLATHQEPYDQKLQQLTGGPWVIFRHSKPSPNWWKQAEIHVTLTLVKGLK